MARTFKENGWQTLTIDIKFESDWKIDILKITKEELISKLGGEPDYEINR